MSAVLLGGVAVLVAILALDWYDTPPAPDSVTVIRFHGLKLGADRLDVPWLVSAYFDWAAEVLLIALIAVGTLANLVFTNGSALRTIGVLLALVAVALTYYALQQLKSYGPAGTNAFDHADAGVWFTLGGYLLAGVGAAIGPRRI